MLIDNVVGVIVQVVAVISGGNSSSRDDGIICCCFLVFDSGQFRRFAGTHFVSSSLDGLDDVLWRRCVNIRDFSVAVLGCN